MNENDENKTEMINMDDSHYLLFINTVEFFYRIKLKDIKLIFIREHKNHMSRLLSK